MRSKSTMAPCGAHDAAASPGHAMSGLTDVDSCLRAYADGSYLFASPTITLVARGEALTLDDHHDGRLPAHARALLENARKHGVAQPILIGMVPFDARQPARLIVPETYLRAAPLRHAASPERREADAHAVSQRLVPAPSEFEKAVEQALRRLDDAGSGLDKVVLARTLEIQLAQPLDRLGLLRNLLAGNQHGYTYAIRLAASGSNAAGPSGAAEDFIGATPELLVRREGSRVIVNPLAGTAARHADPQRDAEIGQALLQSAKDRYEHAVVIDDVVRVLQPFCSSLEIPPGPALTRTDTLWHLSTTIHGELRDPTTHSLELALAMHPTPAVCGQPRQAAFDLITQLESFDRGYYAGMVGWCDAQGDGEWAVALRCARCSEKSLTLYAGAGIVSGSEPAKELAETGNKFRTMLNAIGLDCPVSTH